MPDNFFIKPARDGLVVRDPVTREQLPAAGDWKPKNKYWVSRRTEGSVVATTPPAEPAAKPGRGSTTREPGGEQS